MIIQLKDGTYRVFVDVGKDVHGKRVRRTKKCRTKRESESWERKFHAERERLRGRPVGMTLSEYVDTVFMPEKEAVLTNTSLDTYRADLRLRILPALGKYEMGSIDRAAVQKMVDGCSTPGTAKRSRELLRNIFNSAIERGLVENNPASGRFKIVGERRMEGMWLTTFDAHMPLLEAAQGTDVEPILVLGLCFGLRKGEILGAMWTDIEGDMLHISRGYVKHIGGVEMKPTKTPQSNRRIPIPEYAAERFAVMPHDDEYIVPGPLSPSTAAKRLKRWLVKNGQPLVTMQTLRHSFASAAINAGVPVPVVSRWLGHTNITTTYNRYVKATGSDLRREVDAIDTAMCQAAARNGTRDGTS